MYLRVHLPVCTGLDIPKGARELVLPDDPRIVVFAATVATDPNNAVTPACDLLRVSLPEKGAERVSRPTGTWPSTVRSSRVRER